MSCTCSVSSSILTVITWRPVLLTAQSGFGRYRTGSQCDWCMATEGPSWHWPSHPTETTWLQQVLVYKQLAVRILKLWCLLKDWMFYHIRYCLAKVWTGTKVHQIQIFKKLLLIWIYMWLPKIPGSCLFETHHFQWVLTKSCPEDDALFFSFLHLKNDLYSAVSNSIL